MAAGGAFLQRHNRSSRMRASAPQSFARANLRSSRPGTKRSERSFMSPFFERRCTAADRPAIRRRVLRTRARTGRSAMSAETPARRSGDMTLERLQPHKGRGAEIFIIKARRRQPFVEPLDRLIERHYEMARLGRERPEEGEVYPLSFSIGLAAGSKSCRTALSQICLSSPNGFAPAARMAVFRRLLSRPVYYHFSQDNR